MMTNGCGFLRVATRMVEGPKWWQVATITMADIRRRWRVLDNEGGRSRTIVGGDIGSWVMEGKGTRHQQHQKYQTIRLNYG